MLRELVREELKRSEGGGSRGRNKDRRRLKPPESTLISTARWEVTRRALLLPPRGDPRKLFQTDRYYPAQHGGLSFNILQGCCWWMGYSEKGSAADSQCYGGGRGGGGEKIRQTFTVSNILDFLLRIWKRKTIRNYFRGNTLENSWDWKEPLETTQPNLMLTPRELTKRNYKVLNTHSKLFLMIF